MRAWLRQRLINLLVDTDSSAKPMKSSLGSIAVRLDRGEDICVSDGSIDLPDPINFRVQTVSGGTVVESRWYDHKKDEHRTKLHIITPDESLSESIGKIVTMELLQK
jgi:hypothetical protein